MGTVVELDSATTVPDAEGEYRKLFDRLARLRETRAGLAALEAQKAAEREVLCKELEKAGVDVNNLDAEIARLEADADAHLTKATDDVNGFEAKLKALEQPI